MQTNNKQSDQFTKIHTLPLTRVSKAGNVGANLYYSISTIISPAIQVSRKNPSGQDGIDLKVRVKIGWRLWTRLD